MKIFYADMRAKIKLNLFNKLEQMLERPEIKQAIPLKDALVAVKIHFGEDGNLSYIHPRLVRCVADWLKSQAAQPFLTDSNSLYVGSRSDAVRHLRTAYKNGFGYEMQGIPAIIADGLRGLNVRQVEIGLKHFSTVDLGAEAAQAQAMVCLTHFKAHELTGIGGAIKNVGMGLAARSGKLAIHSTVTPYMDEKCEACGQCIVYCPGEAITLGGPGGQAQIEAGKCLGCGQCVISCPGHHTHIRWDETVQNVQEKICELAYGLLVELKMPAIYVNFVSNVTPECDCYGHSDAPIVPDVGILVGTDPVAIDQASADLVNAQPGIKGTALPGAYEPGEDKFKAIYPQIDWTQQLSYGEQIGLGRRQYELVKLV